jgi:hypothetical protein
MPKPKPSRKIIKQEMLWPTPYWYTHIWEFIRSETRVTFNEDMIGSIQGMIDKDKSVRKSNRGGWQSELLPPTGELEPLAFEISELCKSINLGINEIVIPQMWINVNKKNDWNTIHSHGQYILSGTYYVKVPKDSGQIVFRDPRPGAIVNTFMVNRFDKGEFRRVKPIEGLLILFPSYLDHFVEPSNADEDRISISFDVIVTK